MVARRRFRSVKPEFFGDEKVCALSRDARYLAVGLITLADDRGRLRDRPLEILGTLFPEEQVSIAQIPTTGLREHRSRRLISRQNVAKTRLVIAEH